MQSSCPLGYLLSVGELFLSLFFFFSSGFSKQKLCFFRGTLGTIDEKDENDLRMMTTIRKKRRKQGRKT